ncbi:MAG: endonuclease [gamma proteobacterium symbiont of Ctena orbiculata]|nr:MAG: endonuclease [gamma proteobacterium symbiont of Ctena orbiculata]
MCRKRLCFGNYGAIGKRGAWEIEHSRPQSKDGTDHMNNLYAACVSCNRSKGNGTTASARAPNGYRRAPLSKQKKNQNALKWGAAGSLVALFVPPPLRLVAFVAGAAAGALLGHDSEPE